MDRRPIPLADPTPTVIPIRGPDEAQRLDFGDLSDFFNPFLHHFVREALRGGGEVWVSREGSAVSGLLIYNVVERVGSIFTRDTRVAETLFGVKDHAALFSEFPLGVKPETYHICAADLAGEMGRHHFAHPVRMAREPEQPAILRMLHEMYGRIDTSWLQACSPEDDKCFVVEVAGEIAGVGWVSVVGSYGRLHSLSVRPHCRRIGIGSDLWHARMLWARRAGARKVISEISEHNIASLAIATAGGMQRTGRMFLSHGPGGGPTPASTLGTPAERADLVRHVD
ncbi:MAG: GNAT family N-acetyltransferase [Thermoplasmata archaeon]